MSGWLLPRIELTPDQLRAVELGTEDHRLVSGLPGSGKTQVLVHRAAFLRDSLGVSSERFRVFIFTNVLRDYIRAGLQELELDYESVCTFDSWCSNYYRENIARSLPKRGRRPDFDAIRAEVLDRLNGRGTERYSLDFVLVDEGQDLPPTSFAILRRLSRHITVFADHLQKIYEEGANERAILESLDIPQRNVFLLGAYRNSPDVARLAAHFIADEPRRKQYLAQIRDGQVQREKPLMFIARTPKDEMDRLAAVIQQRLVMNQRVGIIVPKRKQAFGFKQGLEERDVTVELAVATPGIHVCFDNLTPKIATYHSAKGLTFDSVILPRVTEDALNPFGKALRRRMLFVGIARATQWVYLSTVEGREPEEFETLESAEAGGHLVIQDDWVRGDSPEPPEPYSIL